MHVNSRLLVAQFNTIDTVIHSSHLKRARQYRLYEEIKVTEYFVLRFKNTVAYITHCAERGLENTENHVAVEILKAANRRQVRPGTRVAASGSKVEK